MFAFAFPRVSHVIWVFFLSLFFFGLQESTDIEKGVSIEEKPAAEGHEAWNYHSSTEVIIFDSLISSIKFAWIKYSNCACAVFHRFHTDQKVPIAVITCLLLHLKINA